MPRIRYDLGLVIASSMLLACADEDSSHDAGSMHAGSDASAASPRDAQTDAGTEPIHLSVADHGTQVQAAIGQRVDVTLQTIGEGRYVEPYLSSDAVKFLGMGVPPGQDPGGPTQVFHFLCVDKGTSGITILHSLGKAPDFQLRLQCG